MSQLMSGIGIVVDIEKEKNSMTTATENEITQIASLSDAAEVLKQMGYHARLSDDGVLGGISIQESEEAEADSRDFLFMISEQDGNLLFNCQLSTIGELPDNENQMQALPWVLLAANTEIQPFSVGIINPDGILDETDTLVLTNSIPLGNLNIEEFQSAMDSLRRALVAVVPTLVVTDGV